MAKVIPRPQLSFWENIYFVEIFKGLATTWGHAQKSLTKAISRPATILTSCPICRATIAPGIA